MGSFGECLACDEMFELPRTAAGLLPDIDIKIDHGQRRRREIAAHPREFRLVAVPGQNMRQFGEAGIMADEEEKFCISGRLSHHLLKRAKVGTIELADKIHGERYACAAFET